MLMAFKARMKTIAGYVLKIERLLAQIDEYCLRKLRGYFTNPSNEIIEAVSIPIRWACHNFKVVATLKLWHPEYGRISNLILGEVGNVGR